MPNPTSSAYLGRSTENTPLEYLYPHVLRRTTAINTSDSTPLQRVGHSRCTRCGQWSDHAQGASICIDCTRRQAIS